MAAAAGPLQPISIPSDELALLSLAQEADT
jgi:hypothetical protein